jgi:hypothetical protein
MTHHAGTVDLVCGPSSAVGHRPRLRLDSPNAFRWREPICQQRVFDALFLATFDPARHGDQPALLAELGLGTTERNSRTRGRCGIWMPSISPRERSSSCRTSGNENADLPEVYATALVRGLSYFAYWLRNREILALSPRYSCARRGQRARNFHRTKTGTPSAPRHFAHFTPQSKKKREGPQLTPSGRTRSCRRSWSRHEERSTW